MRVRQVLTVVSAGHFQINKDSPMIKKLLIAAFVAVLVIFAIWAVSMRMQAQSSYSMFPGGTLAQCTVPAPGLLVFCNVAGDPANSDGAYVSANGAPYFLIGKTVQQNGAVLTFNGRAGAVMPTQNDYSYTQLSGKPTTINCQKFAHANVGMVATGCTIQ